MKTDYEKLKMLILMILIAGFLTTYGQNRPPSNLLNKPKDIVYDPVRKCTYISNYNGDNILKMDSATGNIASHAVSPTRIFPNPVKESCQVTFSMDRQTPVVIRVFDQKGQVVEKFNHIIEKGFCRVSLELSSIKNGIYLLRIDEGGKQPHTEKLVIVK